ncbi:MAG: hypothetical protein GY950_23785 [bacterium]|nr:hypothetical protein [bacterium]
MEPINIWRTGDPWPPSIVFHLEHPREYRGSGKELQGIEICFPGYSVVQGILECYLAHVGAFTVINIDLGLGILWKNKNP